MPTTTEATQSLLARRYPLMVDADASPQWCPLPSDLPAYLRTVLPSNPGRWLILELFQHLQFTGGVTFVTVSDAVLESRTGMSRKEIRDVRRSCEFRRLVSVSVGEQREAGEAPIATVYDLHKLMLRYNSWTNRDEDLAELERVVAGAVVSK